MMRNYARTFSTLIVFLLAIPGCVPTTWLPDSSGFIYVKVKGPSAEKLAVGQLVHFDIKKNSSQVIVDDIGSLTFWPAISPDGKRVAIARYTMAPDRETTCRVVIYDLAGKKLRETKDFPWCPHGEEKATMVFWSPKDDILVLTDMTRTAFYKLNAENPKVMENSRPILYGGTPIRPDGKGCLMQLDVAEGRQPRVALVDWEGNESKIDLSAYEVQKPEARAFGPEFDTATAVLVAGLLLPSGWDGNSAWAGPKRLKSTMQVDTARKSLFLTGGFAGLPVEVKNISETDGLRSFDLNAETSINIVPNPDPARSNRMDFVQSNSRVVAVNHKTGEEKILVEKVPPELCMFLPSPDAKYIVLCFDYGLRPSSEPPQTLVFNNEAKLVCKIVTEEK